MEIHDATKKQMRWKTQKKKEIAGSNRIFLFIWNISCFNWILWFWHYSLPATPMFLRNGSKFSMSAVCTQSEYFMHNAFLPCQHTFHGYCQPFFGHKTPVQSTVSSYWNLLTRWLETLYLKATGAFTHLTAC